MAATSNIVISVEVFDTAISDTAPIRDLNLTITDRATTYAGGAQYFTLATGTTKVLDESAVGWSTYLDFILTAKYSAGSTGETDYTLNGNTDAFGEVLAGRYTTGLSIQNNSGQNCLYSIVFVKI